MWTALLTAYQAYSSQQKNSGNGAAPGQSTSGTVKTNADVDFSGFTVATGSAKAYGATIKKGETDDGLAGLTESMPGRISSPVVLLGLGGMALLVAWKIFSKK